MEKNFFMESPCPGGCGKTVAHRMDKRPPICFTCEVSVDTAKPGSERAISPRSAAAGEHSDPGAHYRREIRKPITDEDIARGYVIVKVDPYRTCRVYGIQGGPHEHATKKLLRGEAKGHEERQLIAEVRSCLDRWEEMIAEDEEEARCR